MAKEEPGEGQVVGYESCRINGCGQTKQKAVAIYDSGWAHCFVCGENYRADGDYSSVRSSEGKRMADMPFIQGEYEDLVARSISEETCKKYKYQVGVVPKDHPLNKGGKWGGKKVHIENYYEGNTLVGQKLRDKDKNFACIGSVSRSLFGRNASPAGGKLLVVTEGAIDCLSYVEVRKTWPCVSIPNGTQSAVKAFEANIEYLESFEKVVLAFDNDEPGQQAVESVKNLLSPGKVYIANLDAQYKDFNEALDAGDTKAIMNAVFNAEEVRPDGIVSIEQILEEAMQPVEMGLPWFIPQLTELTYGRRWGECIALGAGTGIGKTDFITEQVAFDVVTLGYNVGCIFLEQKPAETAKRIAGKLANRRFHVPDGSWTQEELRDSLFKLKGCVSFYDSFGQTDWKVVKTAIRHMYMASNIRIFYLDHLTAMADTSDERGSLEQIMKEMAGLANELDIIIIFVSHLATPDGTPHEEGGRVAIRHFKGSRSIGFWSYFMFGIERDQQSEDPIERSRSILRVLKDRYTGQATGHTIELGYDPKSGRTVLPDAQGMIMDSEDEEF